MHGEDGTNMGVFYASRETVMDALDVKASAYTSGQVDRAIDSGSRDVESLTNRIFYPLLATKSWPYPNTQGESFKLWLDGNELASVTTFTSGGVTVPATDYYLEPQAYGPPYDSIEINRGTSSALTAAFAGPQRSLNITGVFCGCALEEASAGTLSASLTSSATTFTSSQGVAVGRVLRVDSERMLVTERNFVTSSQTVQTPLTANLNNNTLAVTDGTQFSLRESLLIDAERVLVVDIAGNNLIIKRAQQGSTLAAHTGSTIYWHRQLTVTRGALGTSAASHAISATVVRHVVPPLVEQLSAAYALTRLAGEGSGYARQIGSGSSERAGTMRQDITSLEASVIRAHGRLARQRAV
jgi:hypothetical protein